MSHTLQKTDKLTAKFTLTIPKAEIAAALEHAAEHLGEDLTLPGFRKGMAPLNLVRERVGEKALFDHAAEELIRNAFVEAMVAEDLETVGQPYFTVEKMSPDEDLVVIAEISLFPQVKKLADFKTLSIQKQSSEPKPETVEQAKKDLQRLQTKEVIAPEDATVKTGDKVVVDLKMTKDGVEIEGGSAKDHQIYTAENHYIPGFVDAILGAKKGEQKTFTLPFPADHYQKHLAGQEVDFLVTVNNIYHLEIPPFDDELAKKLKLNTAAELETKLIENLRQEAELNELNRQEKTALELLAEKSDFDEFSDLLVNQEIDKMTVELQNWTAENGIEFNDYLKSIGKSITDLKLDFTPQAITRLKVALVLKAVAKQEGLTVDQTALESELDKIAENAGGSAEIKERVYSPQFRERIENQMLNRQTINFLKGLMIK